MKPSDQRTLLIILLCFVSKVATYLCRPSASMCYLVCLCVLSKPLLRLRCLSAPGATSSAHAYLVCLTCLCVLFGVHLCLFCMLCLCVLSFASARFLAFFACSSPRHVCLCVLHCMPLCATSCAYACSLVCYCAYSNVCSACFLACPCFLPYLPVRASLLASVCALVCLCVS